MDEIHAFRRTVGSMMRRVRRSFSPEFKAEVVGLIVDGGRSISKVVKSSDITTGVVSGWVQKAEGQKSSHRCHGDTRSMEEKLRQLEKKYRKLEKSTSF